MRHSVAPALFLGSAIDAAAKRGQLVIDRRPAGKRIGDFAERRLDRLS